MSLIPAEKRPSPSRQVVLWAAVAISATTLSACSAAGSVTTGDRSGIIRIVAAQNEYGNVASQIGGRYVSVSSIESNPNTDPHTYEVSPGVASEVSAAQLVIENGVGYDDFMTRIESASPNAGRKVLDVQHLLGLPDNTPNPHLWYDPKTMPAVARQLATELSAIQPPMPPTSRPTPRRSSPRSSRGWPPSPPSRRRTGGPAAATTEPVADYLLPAMGIDNLTPFQFQADIMNGTDPSPQDITLENGFFTGHQVKVFCYNQQVMDSLTRRSGTPRRTPVSRSSGVYETMPTPGYDYQRWMTGRGRRHPERRVPRRLDRAPVIEPPGQPGGGPRRCAGGRGRHESNSDGVPSSTR